MTKNVFLISAALAMSLSATAATLTPAEALARISGDGPHKIPSNALVSPQLKLTANTLQGEPAVYVFDRSDNQGYMVVSADDCTIPLLGYTDSGSFNPSDMPPALKYWIDTYAKQISYLKDSNLAPVRTNSLQLPEWDPIEPLVKTKWDQDAPYSNDCPESAGQKCYTGCVATSMAQVMNYFKYPEIGKGMVTYTTMSLKLKLSMSLGKTPFDWDNMLDTYISGQYNETQANAVAYLMKACGYSVQMDYTPSLSGAYSFRVKDALVDNFNYDENISYLDRSHYSYNEWAEMLYENLKNIGPVIYDGTAPMDGGHSFICDGYDGNGYFHFNWGWSGMSDGYFALDALNPSSLGIGGGSLGGYDFDQDAVFGIQPPTQSVAPENKLSAFQYGSLYGEVIGNTLQLGLEGSSPLGWGYSGPGSAIFSFGVIVENLEDSSAPLQYADINNYSNVSFQSGTYMDCSTTKLPVQLKNLSLDKGVPYKVTIATQDQNDPDKDWVPVSVNYGSANYVTITKKGLSYDVENTPMAKFSISDLALNSTLYNGCPTNISLKIANETDLQLSQGITFVLVNDNDEICFQSDSFFLTLNPGESIEKDCVASFFNKNNTSITAETQFSMKVLNLENNSFYDMEPVTVTMNRNPGKPTIMTKVYIDNAPLINSIYEVADYNDIQVRMTLKVGKGYYAYPTSVYIMELDESGQYLNPIVNHTFSVVPFLNAGEDIVLTCSMNFANPQIGKIYYLQGRYSSENSGSWIGNQAQFMVKETGIENVTELNEGIQFIYDKAAKCVSVISDASVKELKAAYVNGNTIPLQAEYAGNSATLNLENLNNGIIVLTAIDSDNKTKSIKLAI